MEAQPKCISTFLYSLNELIHNAPLKSEKFSDQVYVLDRTLN